MTLESSTPLNTPEVESLLSSIAQSGQEIVTATSELSNRCNDIAPIVESLETSLTEVQTALQVSLEDLDPTAAIAEMHNWLNATTEVETQINDLVQSVQSAVDDFEQALSDAQETFDDSCGQAQAVLGEIGDDLGTLTQTVNETKAEVESAFSELVETIARLHSQITEFQSSTEASFEDCSQALTDTHMNAVDEQFDDLIEQVGQTQLSELENHFTQMSEQFTQLFSMFSMDIEGLSNQLQERCGQILEDTGQYCTSDLKEQLEAAFREMIEETVKELVAEVVENVVLMTTGSSITGSLSPILPALVVAKKTAELANAGLDLLGL